MTVGVVELAGPAGAGKTTVARALVRSLPGARLGSPPGRLATVRSVVTTAPVLLATRSVAAPGRWWSEAEVRSVGYLLAWQHQLRHQPRDAVAAEPLLLDHGPVFRLAMLVAGRPQALRHPVFGPWWWRTATAWAGLLDAVVVLDAPTDELIARIEARPREHRVRGADPREAERFIDAYRVAFDEVLRVVSGEGTPVVRVDTAAAPEAVADDVRTRLLVGTSGDRR
jgi:AAA domain